MNGENRMTKKNPHEEKEQPESREESAEALLAEKAALEEEVGKLKNALLYERAELDNFKKRTEKRYQESLRTASEAVVRDIIPVLDNLERALEHAAGAEAMAEGLSHIIEQLKVALGRHGVEEIPALGEKFDPNLHEALAQIPGEEAGIVLAVHEKGYTLGGKLLRPSKVLVSMVAQ